MSKLDSFNGFLAAAVDAQGGVSETLKLPPSADRKGLLRFVDARITACTAISPDTTAEQHADEGCAVFSDSQIQDRTLSQYYTEKLIVAAHDLSIPAQH